MKVSEQWLREWLAFPESFEQWAARFTRAGLEVVGPHRVNPGFSGVVTARILETAAHPDAARLQLCQVDCGSGELQQIVCGAPNARPGLVAPLARPGAVLPDGKRIDAAMLRGVASAGMLCGASELALEDRGDGLLELPADTPIGVDLMQVLGLDDAVCELELTPNRADCLSMLGVARESRVLYGLAAAICNPATGIRVPLESNAVFPVKVAAPAACPRFLLRTVTGISPDATTPLWMAERLRRAGVRPLHPVVDASNYVLLELGQPTHAYDAAALRGGIEVRQALAGESFELLDGQTPVLDDDTLIIADAEGPVALAGIMGGRRTAVSASTTELQLEAAWFVPTAIAGRARRYKLHTDASHRFERGVDPQLTRVALERLTSLVIEICGGQAGPVVEQADPARLVPHAPVRVRQTRVERVLGIAIDAANLQPLLEATGSEVTQVEPGVWSLQPPTHRYDLDIESDYIEEVARLMGYDRIPAATPRASLSMLPVTESVRPVRHLQDVLVQRGYQEVINFAFTDSQLQQLLEPDVTAVAVANPIAADLSVMRTSLWPGLIRNLETNLNRQSRRLRLFELGTVFSHGSAGDYRERTELALLTAGSQLPEQWGEATRLTDFHDLRADLEALAGGSLEAGAGRLTLEQAVHPALHPGQSARICAEGRPVGWLGRLHPAIEAARDLAVSPLLLAIELESLLPHAIPVAGALSRFPASRRDLALVLNAEVPAAAVLATVRAAAGAYLTHTAVFDVYTGAGIETGRKSLALSLIFQDSSSTLNDIQVDEAVARVRVALESGLAATIRG